MRIIRQLGVPLAFVLMAACNSGDASGPNASSGCAWHGNCSTRAAQGAYDCSGNLLMRCQSGRWVSVVSCSSLSWTSSSGFSYSCTCKGGCGTSTVECSYAFNICGGHAYDQP